VLSSVAGRDKLHCRLNGESQRRAARDVERQMGANIDAAQADPARKSVPVSGVPRMYGAPRVAIVGNRLSAGILTDGKETRG
jgi:hypothetical protein